MRFNLTPAKERLVIAAAFVAGIALIGYGMVMKNNPVFLLGIVTVIAAYLVIRRRLK